MDRFVAACSGQPAGALRSTLYLSRGLVGVAEHPATVWPCRELSRSYCSVSAMHEGQPSSVPPSAMHKSLAKKKQTHMCGFAVVGAARRLASTVHAGLERMQLRMLRQTPARVCNQTSRNSTQCVGGGGGLQACAVREQPAG